MAAVNVLDVIDPIVVAEYYGLSNTGRSEIIAESIFRTAYKSRAEAAVLLAQINGRQQDHLAAGK